MAGGMNSLVDDDARDAAPITAVLVGSAILGQRAGGCRSWALWLFASFWQVCLGLAWAQDAVGRVVVASARPAIV